MPKLHTKAGTLHITKRKRARSERIVTFRDLHSTKRKGDTAQVQVGHGGGLAHSGDHSPKLAQQNSSSEVVINHVLT